MEHASTQDVSSLVVYVDGEDCCAILQAPNPRIPVRYQINRRVVAEAESAITTFELQRTRLGDADNLSLRADMNQPSADELCMRVSREILPESILSVLRETCTRGLVLHLSPDLINLPWEYLHDGRGYLAATMQIGRRLIADDEPTAHHALLPASELDILQIVDDEVAEEAQRHLAVTEPPAAGVRTSRRPTSALSVTDLADAAREFTLIHYLGPIRAGSHGPVWKIDGSFVDVGRIITPESSCALVISERCERDDADSSSVAPGFLTDTLTGNGAAHIVSSSSLPLWCRAAFQAALYSALGRGETVGQALLDARRSASEGSNLWWAGYQLYGDLDLKLLDAPISTSPEDRSDAEVRSEYRQLTILFCDIVDSTAISSSIGVNEWDEILKQYNAISAAVVARHGGTVHQYKGDGLVVYFGYPTAYEDSARRAVRAAVELAREFEEGCVEAKELVRSYGIEPLKVRIGIHTGPVVVADIFGNATATGVTVAYTERLQHFAPHNRVVISAATFELVKSHYEVRSLGKNTFKGIPEPQDCYLIERDVDSAYGQRQQTVRAPTPFFGRGNELDLLEREWQSLRPGSPRVVVVSGEAGIGKTRLVREFRPIVKNSDALMFEARCSAYFKNSAWYCLTQGLRHLLRVANDATPDAKLDAIDARVPFVSQVPDLAAAVATLLSVPYDSRYPKLAGSPQSQKRQVGQALLNWLSAVSQERPFYFLIEDVQWMDPSTRDLLMALPEHIDGGSVMLVMTHRTEGAATWRSPLPERRINLGRVSNESARSMILSTPGGEKLSEQVVNLLIEQTDGVPLFIEESTSMAVESLIEQPAVAEVPALRYHAGVRIPATIQDLLTARLDRIGSAKLVAQTGSAIGREFSYDLLSAVCPLDEAQLQIQLATLAGSGLITARMAGGRLFYTFKHALVRDAAYQSLLNATRRTLHADIAAELESRNYRGEPESAELLAHHYTEAHMSREAIDGWMLAGREAIGRSAQKEAIHHFERAQEVMHSLPRDSDVPTSALELKAQLLLAGCHSTVGGYGSTEAGRAFERAEALAQEQDNPEALLRARLGSEAYHHMRGNFERAYRLAADCLAMVEASSPAGNREHESGNTRHTMQLAQANWTIGNVLFHQAEFALAIPYMDRCIELCAPIPAASRKLVQDPVVMCSVYKAWYLWEAGFPDEALQQVRQGVAIARECGHPFGIGVALAFRACIHFFRREFSDSINAATESITVCEEPGFRTWYAWAKVLRGRAMSESDDTRSDGIAEILDGLRLWDESNAIVTRPFALALLAEACSLDGQASRALDLVEQADQTIEQYGERYYEPEVSRLRGLFLAGAGQARESGRNPEAWLETAVTHAQRRGMRSSELRALTDLVIRQLEQTPSPPAAERLERALAWFAEGFDTGDLIRAREVLDRIGTDQTCETNNN